MRDVLLPLRVILLVTLPEINGIRSGRCLGKFAKVTRKARHAQCTCVIGQFVSLRSLILFEKRNFLFVEGVGWALYIVC
ncbi:hypothetical protein HZH66_007525 [Vespula vulgaris]|uniref:Secreted protein n=1 Tax=Vespula vulgaris TaxID=7454 RepID=A0A834N700_VESVU|nr:hypothetical protein HZH66_007525 [Vespula vulgaris]